MTPVPKRAIEPEGRYRTIVADPPWPIAPFPPNFGYAQGKPVPYPTMTVEKIKQLPVSSLAERDNHKKGTNAPREGCVLYLWATTEYLYAAHEVALAWRFTPKVILVWCKKHRPGGLGGTFRANVEFVIVARRGSPPRRTASSPTRWFTWPVGEHSVKPDAFFDLVEQVSPGPYLELFARRQRLGWDTWGDEALEHVEMLA